MLTPVPLTARQNELFGKNPCPACGRKLQGISHFSGSIKFESAASTRNTTLEPALLCFTIRRADRQRRRDPADHPRCFGRPRRHPRASHPECQTVLHRRGKRNRISAATTTEVLATSTTASGLVSIGRAAVPNADSPETIPTPLPVPAAIFRRSRPFFLFRFPARSCTLNLALPIRYDWVITVFGMSPCR